MSEPIWATAESWGYGPAAKLDAVLECLAPLMPCQSVRLFASGSCRQLLSYRSALDTREELLRLLESRLPGSSAPLLVNVMDAEVQLAAAAAGVRCVYIDSLMHLWMTMAEYGIPYYEALERAWRSVPASDSRAARSLMNPHDKHWLAHRVSSLSLYQELNPFTGFRRELVRHVHARAVGLVVDPRLRSYRGQDDPVHVLIAFGGRARDAAYTTDIIDSVTTALRHARRSWRITLAGASVGVWTSTDARVTALRSRPDFIARFSASGVVITPPGLTTVAECIATRRPCIVLPPTSVGETANRALLQEWHARCNAPDTLVFIEDPRALVPALSSVLTQDLQGVHGVPCDGAGYCARRIARLVRPVAEVDDVHETPV